MVVLNIFFRLRVSGRENVPKYGGFILASNHNSHFDPVVLGVACSRKLNFMARHGLFKNRYFARLLTSVGAFPIIRDSADASALKEAIRRLKSKEALLIFPEGTRSKDASVRPQGGIGFLAEKAHVPVVPAFIGGTDKALPKGARFVKLTQVTVRFGQQISFERREPREDIAKSIMASIGRLSCAQS